MVLLALAGFYIEAFSSSPAPAVVVFRSVKCSKPFLDDLDIEACLACISLPLPLSLSFSLVPCTNLTCRPMLRLPNELQR